MSGKKGEATIATIKSEAKRQAEFVAEAEAMYERLRSWRGMHPEASLDEIGEKVTRERQRLMGRLMGELATQPEEGVECGEVCKQCGKEMRRKGKRLREMSHLEGQVRINREYHHCDECQSGLFPPRRQTAVGKSRLDAEDDRECPATGR